ncbi:MAG: hypothetical protein GY739_11115 [Mesoflavibacter sp.]|nr:hypothetical protein [Mesoflavibacter sp.]
MSGIKIYSKEVADKYDAFVSRLFEGLEIEGKKEDDFRIIEKPHPNKIPQGSNSYKSNKLYGRSGTININGDILTTPSSVGLIIDGTDTSSQSIPSSPLIWNEELKGYRYEFAGTGYSYLVKTTDYGQTVTMFRYFNNVLESIRYEYLEKE